METKWLEDFVSLAETRSFSRSALARHVTQPAFSRRIQALEAWAGMDLVDRSSYPTRLTPAGETLLAQAVEILGSLQATRNMLRSHQAAGADMIEFAVPHALAFSFFPHWLMELRKQLEPFKCRLNAFNVHDAVLQLAEGHCDLLLAYHHPSQPLQLDADRYEMLSLGQDTLAAFAKPDAEGQPLFRLPGHKGQKIPFLAYADGAWRSVPGLATAFVGGGPTVAALAMQGDRLVVGGGTGGSRSAMASGNAIAEAAAKVIEKGIRIAAFALEAAEVDVEFDRGAFRVAGTDRANRAHTGDPS
jgi:DNA-binding transcriptional LysR family regulator